MNKYALMIFGIAVFTTALIFMRQYLETKNILYLLLALLLFNVDFMVLAKTYVEKNEAFLYVIRSISISLIFYIFSIFVFDEAISPAQIVGIFLAAASIVFLLSS
jgi:multidrug transporter EmrE-like cation transporter